MSPLGPYAVDRRVAVAVSGGADSMALAWLLARWGQPVALIVDHGLRPESAAEAAEAAARLAAAGIRPEVIRLDRLRPGGAAARTARYDALERRCVTLGFVELCVAHHAQDQAETVLMRQSRGSGPLGLAGMATSTVRGEVRLLRPLLGVYPARLRATLRAAGVEWTDDPGNLDPATVRGALRHSFIADATRVPGALMTQHDAARDRAQSERAVADTLARCVTITPDGQALVSGPLCAGALSALVWAVSGRAYPPPPAMIARALPLRAQTLHGVRVTPAGWRGAGWVLAPERVR